MRRELIDRLAALEAAKPAANPILIYTGNEPPDPLPVGVLVALPAKAPRPPEPSGVFPERQPERSP